MNVSRLKVFTTDREKIIGFLTEYQSYKYRNHSADMSVLINEEYYFRNDSTQLNMIILKLKDQSIEIDIIGGAGGTGLFNFNFWSEKGYLKKVKKVLAKFSNEFNIKIEEIEKPETSNL